MRRYLTVVESSIDDHHRTQLDAVARRLGFYTRFVSGELTDSERTALKDTEILFTEDPSLIALCGPNLAWVHTSLAGVDIFCGNGPYANILPKGCVLTNNTGAYGSTISEHIIMLLLMLWRGEYLHTAHQSQRIWGSPLSQNTIENAVIATLGCGDIGSAFAAKARALGASQTIGVSRSGTARLAQHFDCLYPIEYLDTVLPTVDALVMCLPETSLTRNIINARRLALLPQHAILVNVGRGTSVDHDALVEALNTGQIAGAALDVTDPEPLPADHPLWTANNCIITPHVAGNMTAAVTRDKTINLFCDELQRYAQGKDLLRVVDLTRGY